MHLNVVITWKRISGLAVLGLTGALLVGWIGLVRTELGGTHPGHIELLNLPDLILIII